jgi:gliding-associated putative ABC transporter substrate-binding component GldG
MIKKISTGTGFMVILLILINFLSERYFIRADFTADKIYTLSKATKDILNDIPKTITVTAYFTEDLPPDIANIRNDFRDLLVEYFQRSKGKVVFEFIDPSEKPVDEEIAQQNGIQPLIANLREKDQVKQQKIYMGAVIKMEENTDVIPFLKPGAAMEYALSTSIKKVSSSNKPILGFLQGQGEPPLEAYQQFLSSVSPVYEVEPFALSDSNYTLSKYPGLIIMSPADTFKPAALQALDKYLDEGGKILLGMNRVNGDFNQMQGLQVNSGLERWLESKGVKVDPEFIIDASCANVGVNQQQGGFSFTTQVPFPYFPLITTFGKHPVTAGIESIVMKFASPIIYKGNPNTSFEEIARSSPKSGTMKLPVNFDINKQWVETDFKTDGNTVAGVLTGKGKAGKEWKIIIITDGEFAENGSGQNAQEVQPDNVNFMVNSIDWLTDQSGLMELRTKEVTTRPLIQLEDSRKAMVKWINFFLPILLAIGYGIYRSQLNRRIRMRRMTPGSL